MISAKNCSLIAKIFAGVIILTGSVLKWLNVFTNAEIQEICLVGFTVSALFGTVDLNIALDKFTKKQQ